MSIHPRSSKAGALEFPFGEFLNLPLVDSTLSKFSVPTHTTVKEGVLVSLYHLMPSFKLASHT